MSKDGDLLDRVIVYLAKREGIDKTLKLIRYTSRLVVAVSPQDSDAYTRFSSLEKSVGVSRKAFRLGKFLQDINNLRKSKATGYPALLELLAYGGEGVYYFIEQLVWLMKTGAMGKGAEKELSNISAWAELVGYIANIWLSLIKLKEIRIKEAKVLAKVEAKRKEPGGVLDAVLERELAAVKLAKVLRLGAIVQDLADSTLALNDIRGGKDKLLSHPVTLALAGLTSGLISSYKNWTA